MKKIIIVFMIIPILFGCSMQKDRTEQNIVIVEKYIDIVESMDYDGMGTMLSDDYQGLGTSFNDSINKQQAIASWKYNVENLYEKIEYKREQHGSVIINKGPNKGEWVSSWAELNITYKNGESVVIWANTAYKVENDKIVKSFTFYNEADALEQLGYVFINPNNGYGLNTLRY